MPELDSISKLRTIPVKVAGEVVNVTFDPAVYTDEWMASWQSEKDDEERNLLFYEAMGQLIKGWDITKDAKPLPISVESFQRLPRFVTSEIFDSVIEVLAKMSPKAAKRRRSDAG